MKTQMSRFQIHDDLTAPEGSLPVLKGALLVGGPAPELPRRAGRLAGGPARLRALPLELRNGTLPLPTLERIALAVAEHYRSRARARDPPAHGAPGRPRHRRGRARPRVGLATTRARPRCCATSRRSSSSAARAPMHLHEEAREAGLERRAAAGGHRGGGSGILHGDGQRRRRGSRGRLRRGDAGAARRLSHGWPAGATAGLRSRRSSRWRRRCCPHLHEAVELVGKRWTGRDRRRAARRRADALLGDRAAPCRDLSDRLLSERMKELEARGIVERHVSRTPRSGSSTR